MQKGLLNDASMLEIRMLSGTSTLGTLQINCRGHVDRSKRNKVAATVKNDLTERLNSVATKIGESDDSDVLFSHPR